jgi:hypothetical protein
MASGMQHFRSRLEREVLAHPVITDNAYTRWFARGEMTFPQAQAFLVEFSVFSNQFLVAQLHKMVNAETQDEMRASKEILANEIGVGFRGYGREDGSELGSIDGSIEGGRFHFHAAHFELLVRMAEQMSLRFEQLGKRRCAAEPTLYFCDELIRLYGNEDPAIAKAASWAVENWAAAGFWDELVEGWRKFRDREQRKLNLTFFTWHARLEANHARHTWEELEAYYRESPVDENAFIMRANEMLDGVHAFWRGLDDQRRQIAARGANLHMAS